MDASPNKFDSISADDSLQILVWIRQFAETRINSLLIDTRRSIPPHIVLEFGNAGLLGLQAPREYGGLNLSYRQLAPVLEQLAAIDLNLATFVAVHNCLGIRPIIQGAKPEFRSEVLPLMASGRILGAFALTEPGAGSNPNGIEATVTLTPSGANVLNATKMWIGSAGWAGLIHVFARNIDSKGKYCGTSAYAVRSDSAGLKMGPELLTMGMRGMVQNIVRFQDVAVEEGQRLGLEDGGLAIAHDAMMHTRLALGALFLGSMKRCFQIMIRYGERRTGICAGKLVSNPVSRERLTIVAAQIAAIEHAVTLATELLDSGRAPPEELMIVIKACGSEFLWRAVDWAIQMLGGRGYLENNVLTQIMRDARVGRIFEGPTETLLHHVGSRMMMSDESFISFMGSIAAGDIAEQLLNAKVVLKASAAERVQDYPGRQARDLACSRLGDLTAKGLLLAITRSRSDAGSGTWAQDWAASEFKGALEEVMLRGQPVWLSEHKLSDLDQQYKLAIGDLEQTLPAEEWRLDPYLRKKQSESYELTW